jgi:large subunit ribosomal protein L32
MATPKKKVSRSRRNMRRFGPGNRPDKPTTTVCASCHEPVRPHSICNCGFYAGKSVLPAKRKAPETAAQA